MIPFERVICPAAFFAVGLLVAGCNGSVDNELEWSAHDLIDRTVAACRAGNWAEAAGYFAYSGADTGRRYSDVYDPTHEQELMRVKSGGCGGLFYAFPEIDTDYAFGSFSSERNGEVLWYMQELNFPGTPQADRTVVAMLEIEGQLVIADVD